MNYFHALSGQQKQASAQPKGNVQSAIDGAWNSAAGGLRRFGDAFGRANDAIWNSTVKPVQEFAGNTFDNAYNAGAGALGAVGNTLAAPYRPVAGALQGAFNSDGTLGGAIQGMYDGAVSGHQKTMGGYGNAFNRIGNAAVQQGNDTRSAWGQSFLGGGFSVPQPFSAPAPVSAPSPQQSFSGYNPYQTPSYMRPQAQQQQPNPYTAQTQPPMQVSEPYTPPVARPVMPTQQDLAAFNGMGGYDRRSWLDNNKLALRMQGDPNWSDNQRARAMGQVQHPWMKSGAYAELGKKAKAKGVAGLLQKGMRGAGDFLRKNVASSRTGIANKAVGEAGFETLVDAKKSMKPKDYRALYSDVNNRLHGVGNTRATLANSLVSGAKDLGKNKNLQKAVNYGTGAVAGGAGLYGANRLGHSSGKEEGTALGFDTGVQQALETAQAQEGNQGFLQQLMGLLPGRGGINAGNVYSALSDSRADTLRRLQNA